MVHEVAPRDPRLDVVIAITDGSRTVHRTRRDLGLRRVSPAGPVAFTANVAEVASALKRLAPRFQQDARDARPLWVQNRLRIDPGSFSRRLDVEISARRFVEQVQQNPALTRFSVALVKHPPVLTVDQLKGVTGVLGTMTTHTSDVVKRNHNISVASAAIDGTLLSPGEVFSLNGVVGKRTQARGYRTATVFVDAEKVPGIGGGVSQVTGTLFNAAALAGLAITEVHPHSRPVSYLPLGRDATVAYGEKDLKFVNTTGAPVYVACSLQGTTLTATLFGATAAGRTVRLQPNVQRREPGHITAQLYRTIRQNGRVVDKARLFAHTYRWKP